MAIDSGRAAAGVPAEPSSGQAIPSVYAAMLMEPAAYPSTSEETV